MMRIRVLFFSYAADRMNGRQKEFVVIPGTTLQSFFAAELSQALSEEMSRYLFSANAQWVDGSYVLQDGDEIAVIPPVSGG